MMSMKLHNELIVFDLEATSTREPSEDRPPVQTNNFIIEIGAAFLNRELQIVDTFEQLVRPEEPISPFITELTGITPHMCESQPLWKEAAPKFEAWVTQHARNFKSARLCAWGNYFDVPLLRRCYERYALPYPFSGTCFDAKTIAMMWCSLSGHRTDKLGVDAVARLMGIEPEGAFHRAKADAVVEARIVQRVFRDLDGGTFVSAGDGRPWIHVKIQKGS
jgi:DNA polymerase III epsilon subunit-like protein